MGKIMGTMGSASNWPQRPKQEPPAQQGVPIGAEDGIRTRDPHLGKAVLRVLLVLCAPLSCSVSGCLSAESVELLPVLTQWFNALNEADFAESPRVAVATAETSFAEQPGATARADDRNFNATTKRSYIRVEHIDRHVPRLFDRDDPGPRPSHLFR